MSDFGTGKRDPKSGSLSSVDVVSGVNKNGEGFVTVTAHSVGGTNLRGQMTADEAREMALHWLAAAEAADSDAIVFRLLAKVGLDGNAIGSFIIDMRNERAGSGD